MQEIPIKKSIVLPPEERIDVRLNDVLRRAALSAAGVLAVLSVVEVIGYAWDIIWIKHPTDQPAMTSGTAVTFLVASLALLLNSVGAPRTWRYWLSAFLALVVATAGATTFIEHTFQLDWGLSYVSLAATR